MNSPNWSYFELHSVNVKHFHLLQRKQVEKCVTNLHPQALNLINKNIPA